VAERVSSSPVPVEVWAMDEHRLGLKPIVRRVWVPRRTAPTVKVYPRYTWLYLYGFVQPETGKTFWLLLPTVNIAMMNLALREFASAVGAGASKRVVLVLDGAGWHTSAAVVIPEGIELMRLPPYSPSCSLPRGSGRCPTTRSPTRVPANLDELEDTLVARCKALMQDTETVRRHTLFHWWPRVAAAA
jgi:hypothetical protein